MGKSQKHVVTRNGYRTSDTIHENIEDAEAEAQIYKKIIKKYPDGSIVKVVPYDEKVHGVE